MAACSSIKAVCDIDARRFFTVILLRVPMRNYSDKLYQCLLLYAVDRSHQALGQKQLVWRQPVIKW